MTPITRGLCINKDQYAALLAYGLPDKEIWDWRYAGQTFDRCLATFRGRAGLLILAHDLRVFGKTKIAVANSMSALERADIQVIDITHPEDKTISQLMQRANVAISGARNPDPRQARLRGQMGGLRRAYNMRQRRDDLIPGWLVDRIVDERSIPWDVKVRLVHPHFSEATMRRHYGTNATCTKDAKCQK